jgi:hypothetical protein
MASAVLAVNVCPGQVDSHSVASGITRQQPEDRDQRRPGAHATLPHPERDQRRRDAGHDGGLDRRPHHRVHGDGVARR